MQQPRATPEQHVKLRAPFISTAQWWLLLLLLLVLPLLALQYAAAVAPADPEAPATPLLRAASAAPAGADSTNAPAITYRSHYPTDSDRPNTCQEEFRSPSMNVTYAPWGYVPFIANSLHYASNSLDFPVKHFILVVPREALNSSNAMRYEIHHLKHYATNLLLIACTHPPCVSESWNAVFQALPEEPWGVYSARNIAWEPGSLAKAAQQFWPMAASQEVDVGLVGYSNLDAGAQADMAQWNVFVLTRALIERFGLFDEAIYPAFCEDDDAIMRLSLLQPPALIKSLEGVLMLHGARQTTKYISGTTLKTEEGQSEEDSLRRLTARKGIVNCNYFLRKWGCRSENARTRVRLLHDTCKHKTPFGKDVPVWFWHTTTKQRQQDQEFKIPNDKTNKKQLWDLRTNTKKFDVPEHYGEWGGYYEPSGNCRLTGNLGKILPANQQQAPASTNASMGTPAPNCM